MMLEAPFWLVLLVVAGVFWRLAPRFRMAWLAVASGLYVATLDLGSAALLALWGGWLWQAARRTTKSERRSGFDPLRWPLLAIVGVFLAVKLLPSVFADLLGPSSPWVPLGVSYYSFRLLHFGIEARRGTLGELSPGDFFGYLFFFPIFSSGPIERFDHFLEHRQPRWSTTLLVEGLTRIAHGLIKKLVLADLVLQSLLGVYRDQSVFLANLPDLPVIKVWAYLAITSLYLYLDFAGYSDIAIGASRLFGFRIQDNFDWPFLAGNLNEFWKRWHMSLTGWCQSYVYLPLLGRTRNPYLAVYATFVSIGLWHAFSSHWVLWGVFHATGVTVTSAWLRWRRRRRWRFTGGWVYRWMATAITIAFVFASFAFVLPYPEQSGLVGFQIFLKLFGVQLPSL